MSEYTYGDVLEYRAPSDIAWRFMFITRVSRQPGPYDMLLVLAIDPEDDLWIPGETIVTAGVNEMVLADG